MPERTLRALRNDYRVVLFDPRRQRPPHLAYACRTRREARAWIDEWERDPLGLVAVIWPPWAPWPAGWEETPRSPGARSA